MVARRSSCGRLLGITSGNVTSGRTGNGYSYTPGRWSGPIAVSSPAPRLHLTYGTDGALSSLSQSKQSTIIEDWLTLTPTAPPASLFPIANPTSILISLPVPLTSTVTTLKEAAKLEGFSGFNWVQIVNVPPPSPYCSNAGGESCFDRGLNRLVGKGNDPPPSGGYGEEANPYPFYYVPDGPPGLKSSLSFHLPPSPGNILGFADQPGDQCLPPIDVAGVPTGGYKGFLRSPTLAGACDFGNEAAKNAKLDFYTRPVGMIAVGSRCPTGPVTCYEQDSADSGMPRSLQPDQQCPLGKACYATLGEIHWADTFNGTTALPGAGVIDVKSVR